jgi:hypothetical protein
MTMTVFWDVAPYSQEKFTDVSEVLAASIIRAIALKMKAASTSETLVNFYQTTQRYNPEDNHVLIHFNPVQMLTVHFL